MPILLYLCYTQMRFIVILLLPTSFYCFMAYVINHYETIVAQYLRSVPYFLLTTKLGSCTMVVKKSLFKLIMQFSILRLFQPRMQNVKPHQITFDRLI